jgi:HEPN domain-containing protein
MSVPDLCGELMAAALRDLKLIESNLNNPDCADELFGFHAQQAVEKALKAWLRSRGVEYPPTHDVFLLVDLLSRDGVDVGSLYPMEALTPFAVQYRYEGLDLDEDFDRKGIFKRVRRLFLKVQSLLGAGGSPTVGEKPAVYKVRKTTTRKKTTKPKKRRRKV